ncbi:hypothetical protein BJ973_001812 [Actinoplanes tereljensis]|uniref:hypothetical protein n=1 Tax=Paractinoplanes tereljensis TaxID=571912 RepID=UPI001943E274|nr:hypothetical protein [Actinoplanes tereljensis]
MEAVTASGSLTACPAGTSAPNWWWKTSGRMASSLPPVATGYAVSASPRVLPGNLVDSANADSPWSGANAQT